jgi:restriction endonuclease S subunit
MVKNLGEIAKMTSGLYAKPDISPEILYLQAIHYDEFGILDTLIEPKLSLNKKTEPHVLKEGDILFAAKGSNNFAVVYHRQNNKAVASSSFIIIRINIKYANILLPEYLAWYLSHTSTIRSFHKKQLGTTIPSISIKMLREMEIPLPPLQKQKTIISIQNLRNKEKKLLGQLASAKEKKIEQQLLSTIND